MPGAFVIVRDARGSLVHVRRRGDGQCFSCIEVGLYEIVRGLILAEGVKEGMAATAVGLAGVEPPSPPLVDPSATASSSVFRRYEDRPE